MSMMLCVLVLTLCVLTIFKNVNGVDYGVALTKSILFYEAQRSGKLPSNQRISWRGDSALKDGKSVGVNLVGGYYDAGDNVKFGLPLAFTLTMLSWSVIEFQGQLQAKRELSNALVAIKWGTDYLIKAHPKPTVLYGQVGDGQADHSCWQRPEDMTTPRTAYKIDDQQPGADLAAETAAAMAASSIAFKKSDSGYSSKLLTHAKQLFQFAKSHPGQYHNSIPAGDFYKSSGYEDELLWAAAWLQLATNDNSYLQHITQSNSGSTRQMFSWDDKFVGAQALIAKGLLEKKIAENGKLNDYKNSVEQFICNVIQKGNGNIQRTPGGLLWFMDFNNLQYVTSTSFILAAYANSLAKARTTIQCSRGTAGPRDLISFAKSQVDYILGANPKKMSYMVGFGSNYPKQVHHRGASIVSIKKDPKPVGCKEGFSAWLEKKTANPNILEGAVVGGPDKEDQFRDDRNNHKQAEPATANNAPLVGVLARLAANSQVVKLINNHSHLE